MQPKKFSPIMMLAGEASGDLYGGHLVKALKTLNPDLQFFGMGGPRMKEAGVDIHVQAKEVAVVGALEVLTHFFRILRAARHLKKLIKEKKPCLLILIDFPDFNFHIAKFAKKLKIKIFYYISPQVWAWRKGRVKTIKKLVDLMMVILPFEVDFYKKENFSVCFEGHPLIDIVKPDLQPLLKKTYPTIGLLPGSRDEEIKQLLPVLIETALMLKKDYPNAHFILPLASTLSKEMILPYLEKNNLPLDIISNQTYAALASCDVIITASGTITLEAALLQTPMVIIYKLKTLSYLLGRLLVKVPHIGLCNLIANERIVPELLQNEVTPERISIEVKKILNDTSVIKTKLLKIRNLLGEKDVNQRIAITVSKLISK